MKDIIRRILESNEASPFKISIVREYLQAKILQVLQANKAFQDWIFCGGTSLRFLYNLSRYSEDLDFALNIREELSLDNRNALFNERMLAIKSSLEKEGYEIEIKVKSDNTVKSAFMSFIKLLFELNISNYSNQKLSIKIDIDTNPPLGGNCETTVVRTHFPIHLLHYDKPSLFSGKIHALLNRSYTKGRDVYDLVWYLSDVKCPTPNLLFLNNALKQTGWNEKEITLDNWKQTLADKLNSLNWRQARNDVEPFLERKEDIELISEDVVLKLLS